MVIKNIANPSLTKKTTLIYIYEAHLQGIL